MVDVSGEGMSDSGKGISNYGERLRDHGEGMGNGGIPTHALMSFHTLSLSHTHSLNHSLTHSLTHPRSQNYKKAIQTYDAVTMC